MRSGMFRILDYLVHMRAFLVAWHLSHPLSFPKIIAKNTIRDLPLLDAVVDPSVQLPEYRVDLARVCVLEKIVSRIIPFHADCFSFRWINVSTWCRWIGTHGARRSRPSHMHGVMNGHFDHNPQRSKGDTAEKCRITKCFLPETKALLIEHIRFNSFESRKRQLIRCLAARIEPGGRHRIT